MRDEAREVARAGCIVVELLRRANQADRVDVLDNAQHYLRACLLEVEEQQRAWADRTAKRQRRIKTYRARISTGSALIGEHLARVETIETALTEYRQMIRQLGDGIAWTLLRYDPRIIYPLFAERTHHITAGPGLVGPTQVIIDAHKSRELLVIDNDLTRCLGSGDLTVVSSDGRWSMPLSIECKTMAPAGELKVGSEITVSMTTPTSTDPLHTELQDKFCRVVGAAIGTGGRRPRPSDAAQEAEMLERAENVLASVVRRPEVLASSSPHWKSLRNTLSRAVQTGGSYDMPEAGIAYVSVRNLPGDDSKGRSQQLLKRLQSDGFPRGEKVLTVGDFASSDRMAAIIPPISVWPLPLDQRVGLLCGDLFLACVFKGNLWANAFSSVGLQLTEKDGAWIIAGNGQDALFDPLEKLKLLLGIAFSGISPIAVAKQIVEFKERAQADSRRQTDNGD